MGVEALISSAQGYANTLISAAQSAMSAAVSSAGAIGYSVPGSPALSLPNQPPALIDATLPALTNVDLVLPATPGAELVFQDIPPIAVGTVPASSVTAPTIDLPTAPSQIAAFNQTAPSVSTNIAFPDPPSALTGSVGDAPTITERAQPVKPQNTLPEFTSPQPEAPTSPSGLSGTAGASYSASVQAMVIMANGYVDVQLAKYNPEYAVQMARIEAQLTKYMEGGTALDPTVEDAIYSRARSKNNAEARRVRDSIYTEAAGRGFTMPPGASVSAIQQARQAGADNNAKAANEIAIAQAEMEQKNLQFAVTASTGLRTAMVNASLSYMQNILTINGQALDYAKLILNAVIETSNIATRIFSAKLDAYKADAAVYEVRLKASTTAIEIYRAEISALEALTQVDRSRVEVYKARIDSLNVYAAVYRAQIEAVQGRANLEKLKLDVFQSQVQAYQAQVNAKNAEWQGYSAAIDGQTAKARIFTAQVEAFNAQVQGYKVTIDAQSTAVQAMATTNDARSRNYAAKWDGYRTTVQALGEVARTKLENQRQSVVAFQASVELKVASARVASDYYRATSTVAIENAKLSLQAQIEGGNSQRAFGESIARLGTANASIYAGLANSAMAGMNSLAVQTLVEG